MPFDIQPKPKVLPEERGPSSFSSPPLEPPVFSKPQETPFSYSSFPPTPPPKKKRTGWWFFFFFLFLLILGATLFFLLPRLTLFKEKLSHHGEEGASQLEGAIESLKGSDFSTSQEHFSTALEEFQEAEKMLSGWGTLLDTAGLLPGLGEGKAGKNLIQAGAHLAKAGEELNAVSSLFSGKFSPSSPPEKLSLLDLFQGADTHVREASLELSAAEENIQEVNPNDLPEEKREVFTHLSEALPTVVASFKLYLGHTSILEELLGGNGPRKYLFLFQNNNELRATGGFIGTYALLDIANGDIRRFFVDEIFNPDGQLKEHIVPPAPIQKISASWSLHDSNWFPDFPLSAEKAIFFYEKTGGPTVDGVITFTPTVMKRLLAVTGAIPLPQYGITVDAENFLPLIEEQVEEKYDKIENNPKKILSDLTDALFDRLLAVKDMEHIRGAGAALISSLNERHILLYSRHSETEALLDAAGWSGRILQAPHDYLSVVHSNINGFKTDGVIAENINHTSEIEPDGTIIDTVRITRKHNGGTTPYAWWNKVNADYMRVYVPEGSVLLSAEGMTRETDTPPVDYEALGFERDALVLQEEKSQSLDPESGTHIGEESGKTVFGNWVYVSPQEEVTVEYRYRLPLKLTLSELKKGDPLAYSVLYQKQAGREGVTLTGTIDYPDGLAPVWQTGENLVPYGRAYTLKTSLDHNQFLGIVFKKE